MTTRATSIRGLLYFFFVSINIFISNTQFKLSEHIYYQLEVRFITRSFKVDDIDDVKSKLFVSLAAGRFICGLFTMTGILFLAWIVQAIGKDGLSVQNILGTAGAFGLNILFCKQYVLNYSARHPYWVLVINSVTFMVNGLVILLCGDAYPYAIVISGVISALADKAYLQSRKVMQNRVYRGDELTVLGNKLETVAIVAGLAGSGLAMVVPCTTSWIGGLVLVAVTLLTVANYYQIKYLMLLQPPEDE